jgi:hypothetical protein
MGMTENRPNATFNIGSQSGNINNVAGNMTVHGGQHYTGFPAEMIRQELGNLHRIISAMDLDPGAQKAVTALLTDVGRELDQPDRDAKKVARPIERLTALLRDIGALAVSGATLIDPLQRIASWLGPAGHAILQLIT